MGEDALHKAVQFITEMFGASTKSPVYVCSFANQDAIDQVGERHLIDRNPDALYHFARKWDRPHRGVYFAVNTIQPGSQKRGKDHVSEINCLHCDIDFDKVQSTEKEILARLRQVPHLPSKVVHSGNGLHCYWLFQESLEATPENIERTEALLRLLADHLGGDLAACEVSRVLRLPGTHNSKNGEWKMVRIVEDRPIRYQFLEELEEWLETSRPVILRKIKANGVNGTNGHAEHLNPFEAVAEMFAGKAPVDVEKRLAAMTFGAPDKNDAIHPTQLSVTAALVNRGHDLEDIVKIVMEATRAAAGEYGQRWNWRREERGIRQMCRDWLDDPRCSLGKNPEIVETKAGGTDLVVKKGLWLDWNKKEKRPAASCANAILALQNLEIICRKDVFHEQLILSGDPIDEWGPQLTDDSVIMLRMLIKAKFGFDPGDKHTRDAVIFLGNKNKFNPVVEYLDSLKWDNVPRIDRWLTTYMQAPDTELNREFGRLMLLAAVRRARHPGCKFDQIVVFEGSQGKGKSTGIKNLAGEDNFSDQHILGVSDREQQEAFTGVWIHEIAELSGMKGADIERVKQFASRTEDRARPAYARSRYDMKRRGILTATTNRKTYLKDDTGNRRFWPIKTGKVDEDGLKKDRDQLWAEAAKLEAEDASIKLEEKFWEAAAVEQAARIEEDAWLEKIADHVAMLKAVTIADVLEGAVKMEAARIGQSEQNRAARILAQLGFERRQRREGGKRVWKYVRASEPEEEVVSPVTPSGVTTLNVTTVTSVTSKKDEIEF